MYKNYFNFIKIIMTGTIFSLFSILSANAYGATYSGDFAEYLTISDRKIVQIKHRTPVQILNIERLNKVVITFNKSLSRGDFEDFVSNRLSGKVIKSFSISDSSPVSIYIIYDEKYMVNTSDKNGIANITFTKKKEEPVFMVHYSIGKIKFFDGSTYTKVRFFGDKIENSDFVISKKKDDKLSVVFPNTDVDDKHDGLVSSKYINSIRTTESPDSSIVIFGLNYASKTQYRIVKGKNFFDLIIGKGLADVNSADYSVNSVKFTAIGEKAKIEITSSIRNPEISYTENEDSIVVLIKNASVSKDKEIEYDVSEFSTPLTGFDVKQVGNDVEVTIKEREEYHLYYSQFREISEFTIEPMAMARGRGATGKTDTFEYFGEKISLDFSKVSVRNAISMIARTNKMNFVIEDNVKGNLTLVLNDVPWDQALDLILRSNGLGKEVEGNVIRIASLGALASEYTERAKIKKGKAGIEQLLTKYIRLKYKKAIDVKSVFDTIIKSTAVSKSGGISAGDSGVPQGGNGILSSRGTIMVDVEKNILIVRDTREAIVNIERMIAEIDIKPRQVMIEARIVEASDDFSREFGVRLGGAYNKLKNGRGLSVGAGNGVTAGNFGTVGGARGTLVDLPAAIGAGVGGGFAISAGVLAGNILDLELSAAESRGEIKIVSKPRVLVIEGKSANINQGTDIPFTTVSQNGTQTQFKKANLGLVVTPDVKGNNQVQLHILATKDSPSTSSVGNNPIISTKQVETDVLVTNGETIVIGGIYTETNNKVESKVPLLGDIPILGNLFKTHKNIKGRTELLIFITTRVVESNIENKIGVSTLHKVN